MATTDHSAENERLERAVLELLSQRESGKTICPSEVARAHGGSNWRALMAAVREAAWRLESSGRIVILQGGRPVNRQQARGPIRLGHPTEGRGE